MIKKMLSYIHALVALKCKPPTGSMPRIGTKKWEFKSFKTKFLFGYFQKTSHCDT